MVLVSEAQSTGLKVLDRHRLNRVGELEAEDPGVEVDLGVERDLPQPNGFRDGQIRGDGRFPRAVRSHFWFSQGECLLPAYVRYELSPQIATIWPK